MTNSTLFVALFKAQLRHRSLMRNDLKGVRVSFRFVPFRFVSQHGNSKERYRKNVAVIQLGSYSLYSLITRTSRADP